MAIVDRESGLRDNIAAIIDREIGLRDISNKVREIKILVII